MEPESAWTRRDFIRTIAGTAAVGAAGPAAALEGPSAPPQSMPERALGRTRHQVPLFSLGGQAALEQPERTEEALAIVNRAIDLGIRYIDTARVYGRGQSETYLGQVMRTRRREVFLASKTRDRTYEGSMRSLELSLKTLQTDHLDLWQLHNVMTDDDLERIFAKDGALRALERAREQKLVRFLGITGHYDPHVLRRGIERYAFDTVLVALNAADRHRASFIEHFVPAAVERKMGIIGMKIPARGRLFREDGITSMKDAMRYTLTLPVSTVIVGISTLPELEENVRIAREFRPLPAGEMARLEALTKPYAEDAAFFKGPA